MAQLETTAWQYLCCPVGFCDTWEGFIFLNIQKEIVNNGA